MKWSVIRKPLIVLGFLYIITIIPASWKPSLSKQPVVSKHPQLITVAALDAAGDMPSDYVSKLRHACNAPGFAKSKVGPAPSVRVITTWQGSPTSVMDVDCKPYT